jgi:hypothetical protein
MLTLPTMLCCGLCCGIVFARCGDHPHLAYEVSLLLGAIPQATAKSPEDATPQVTTTTSSSSSSSSIWSKMRGLAGLVSIARPSKSSSSTRRSQASSLGVPAKALVEEKVHAAYRLCCACIAGGADPLVLQAFCHVISSNKELLEGLKVDQRVARGAAGSGGTCQVPLMLLACASGRHEYIRVSKCN